ncbi:MAG: hypothetical protein MZW92_25555 [Comamonadaceae bacterium]|nr:hypothetical protein [Comamonadaceae bacterium]
MLLLAASVVGAKVGGGDIVFEVKKAGNVAFSHDGHVGMGMKCTDCHDAPFGAKGQHKHVTMAQMQKGSPAGSATTAKRPSM